ncbi:MAG: hypothetical protein ACOCVA_00775 [Prolixibacteraceae bacterium]
MFGVNTGIKVKYLKKEKEKTGTIEAFRYIGNFAELTLDNGDVIMEQEVIKEINTES